MTNSIWRTGDVDDYSDKARIRPFLNDPLSCLQTHIYFETSGIITTLPFFEIYL